MQRWTITTVEGTDTAAIQDVRSVLQAYHDDLIAEIGATTLTTELEILPAPYTAPDGALLVARDGDGQAVGCVGVKGFSDSECEIKRLYVAAGSRGSGLGRALVRAAMDQARAMGYREVLLIAVARTTTSAQRIYRDMGFEVTPQYRATPLGWDPARFLFMRRSL